MDRHNYVASLILFGSNTKERLTLEQMLSEPVKNDTNLLNQFPDAIENAKEKALCYLDKGTQKLWDKTIFYQVLCF